MAESSSAQETEVTRPAARHAWDEPAIVLERSLEAAADSSIPGARRTPRVRGNGVLGPLGTSGGTGQCF